MQALALWMVGLGALAAAPQEETLTRYEYTQDHMGVPVKIALYAAQEEVANRAAEAAFARIAELDRIMSDYNPQSELRRLCNTSGPGKPVKVSDDLASIIGTSLRLSEMSDGAFDITVGPVVRLWRRARRQKELPDAADLAAARELVGYKLVELDEEAKTIELKKEGMRLDLGGIGKGYAADEARKTLKQHGVGSALVAIAGDIAIGDSPPMKDGWTVAIAPLQEGETPPTVTLRNACISTSGDAFQYVEIGGKRYSHIVDPKTGLGLTQRRSVTVIAPAGVLADGIDSTVCVLGPAKGLELVAQFDDVAAFISQIEDGETRTYQSANWAELAGAVDR